MDFLIEYLKTIKNRLINKRELELIYKSLNRVLNTGVQGLKYDDFSNSPIRYDFVSNMILVNYDAALEYFNSCVGEYDNKTEIINYYFVFSIIHELFHEKQMKEQDREVVSIYKYCYSLLNDTHEGISRVLTQVIYNKLHDYLAIEINANVEAYRVILKMCDDNAHDYFYNNLVDYIKRVYIDYNLVDMYKYLDYKIEENAFETMTSEERIKKGVYLTKKLESIDEIDMNKLLAVN